PQETNSPSETVSELRQCHREGHEFAAHGIERKPHGFESVSTEKGAILFLSENHSRPADTILVFEKSAAYLSFDGLSVRHAECLGLDRIDPQTLQDRAGNQRVKRAGIDQEFHSFSNIEVRGIC